MMTAKCLRRQAATCANLAKETDDDESRERYIRLRNLYLQLADSEDDPADRAGDKAPLRGDSKSKSREQRPH